jgi:hypothetical protein
MVVMEMARAEEVQLLGLGGRLLAPRDANSKTRLPKRRVY